MAKITNTETPEDFALHLLDQLMEKEGEKLTTYQIIQAAQAYATAGMAQATREATGSIDSLESATDRNIERIAEENEGRAKRLGGELPVVEFVVNGGIPSENYTLITDGKDTYWAHKNATTEEIESGVALLRFFSDSEETDAVEGDLEHVDVKVPAKVIRAFAGLGQPVGDYDYFDRDEGKFWVHRSVTIDELKDEIKKLEKLEDEAWDEFSTSSTADIATTSTYAPKKEAVGYSNYGDVYEKEPTKELPKTLREKIEAEIASRNS